MESHNVKCHQIRKAFDIQMDFSDEACTHTQHSRSHLGTINVILVNMRKPSSHIVKGF